MAPLSSSGTSSDCKPPSAFPMRQKAAAIGNVEIQLCSRLRRELLWLTGRNEGRQLGCCRGGDRVGPNAAHIILRLAAGLPSPAEAHAAVLHTRADAAARAAIDPIHATVVEVCEDIDVTPAKA